MCDLIVVVVVVVAVVVVVLVLVVVLVVHVVIAFLVVIAAVVAYNLFSCRSICLFCNFCLPLLRYRPTLRTCTPHNLCVWVCGCV